MSSDYHNRCGRDVAWRLVGVGMTLPFMCLHCNKSKPILGRRMGRNGTFYCADCESKAQAKRKAALKLTEVCNERI